MPLCVLVLGAAMGADAGGTGRGEAHGGYDAVVDDLPLEARAADERAEGRHTARYCWRSRCEGVNGLGDGLLSLGSSDTAQKLLLILFHQVGADLEGYQ